MKTCDWIDRVTGVQCTATTSSRFCEPHRKQAREAWKQKISESQQAKADRDAKFRELFEQAANAGHAAAIACTPMPMTVVARANPLDDTSAVQRAYHVAEGACGFAWITIFPGNCSAANYAKKNLGASKAYKGGMQIWVSAYGQSMERKDAYATAYAEVLRNAGIKAYSGSRMD